LIFDKFEEVIFKGNRLSMSVIGKEGNIRRFKSFELQKFHEKRYDTSKLLIVASGSVEHEELVKLAEKQIGKRKSGTKVKREKYIHRKANDLVLDKDFHQVHSIIGRSTVGLNSKKRNSIKVLSTLLGEGSSSRLFLAVREKLGITYQISSFLNSYHDVSSFGVYYSTNDKQAEKVLEIVLREFKKLRDNKVTDKELKKVKSYIKGGTIVNLESTTNRMIRIANSVLYFNRIIPVNDYLKMIEKVTVEDLNEIANEILDEDKLIKVILKSNNNRLPKVA
jgi:predicted Zn-dependent peptidase